MYNILSIYYIYNNNMLYKQKINVWYTRSRYHLNRKFSVRLLGPRFNVLKVFRERGN